MTTKATKATKATEHDPGTTDETGDETGTSAGPQVEAAAEAPAEAEPQIDGARPAATSGAGAEPAGNEPAGNEPEPAEPAGAVTAGTDENTPAGDDTGETGETGGKAVRKVVGAADGKIVGKGVGKGSGQGKDGSDGDGGSGGGRRGGLRPGGPVLSRALVLVALAAAIVTAVLQWHEAGQLSAQDDTRQQIRTRAGDFGQALLSYDHTKLSQARERVLSMADGDFAKTYDVAFTGGLEGVITRMKADATATVRTVYLNEVDGSNAKAVVVMDSEVRSTGGTRQVLGSYLEMKLVKQKDRWLVSEVSSIGAINESLTKPDGTDGSLAPTVAPSPGK